MKNKTHTLQFTDEEIKIIHASIHAYRSLCESLNLHGVQGFDHKMKDEVEKCRIKFADVLYK